jgi:hypothetical protein
MLSTGLHFASESTGAVDGARPPAPAACACVHAQAKTITLPPQRAARR